MNKSALKVLLAVSALGAFASAWADAVTLVADQLRSASSGSQSTLVIEVPTTWDWNPATGVLTQTGGLYQARRSSLYTDQVTGLVIDTVANTVSATSYNCIEGTFGASINASLCGNYDIGFNATNESTVSYNVGGDASCMSIATGGDDLGPTFVAPPGPGIGGSRGLTERSPGGSCIQTIGARDMTYVFQDNLSTGGTLILWSAIGNGSGGSVAGVDARCVTDSTFKTGCNGAHYMTFVPVPAAASMFAPALGLVGAWARRRRSKA